MFCSTTETQAGEVAGKRMVRFSIRSYLIAVVYVASLTALYKFGVWAVATYNP
jgi:hypothetical protein